MRKVSKVDFFDKVCPMDIVCRPEKMATFWEDRRRNVIGKSTPGYMCQDENGNYTTVRTYYLNEEN